MIICEGISIRQYETLKYVVKLDWKGQLKGIISNRSTWRVGELLLLVEFIPVKAEVFFHTRYVGGTDVCLVEISEVQSVRWIYYAPVQHSCSYLITK